jgi:mycofactocin system glycosyltransferase
MTRFQLDPSTRAVGDGTALLGGSPLRLFRLTAAGRAEFDRIAAGDNVEPSQLTGRLVAGGAVHPLVVADEPHKFTEADVTVVIPTHDDEPERLLELLRHCAGAGAVVFVDDGSSAPLTGVRGANVVRLRHNSGPGAARNAGFRSAQTPLVAFIDSDVDLHPGWLEGLLGHFDDDSVGFVAPRVASGPPAAGADIAVARYEERHSPLDLGTDPARIAAGTRVSYVPAAALVVRTSALQAIDGFNPDLRVGEDVDAVWRLAENGWTGRYEPAVVVEHRPRPTWKALSEQRMAYGESAAALAAVHGSAVAPVRMSPWSLGVWGLAAAGHVLPAAGIAGATAVALIPKLRGVPAKESLRLATTGHLAAGGALATAVRRTWMPIVVLSALGSRRARLVGAAAIVPAVMKGGPARLLDDFSYGVGVWKGVLSRRQLAPLLPSLTAWPPREGRRRLSWRGPWRRAKQSTP